MGVRGLQTYIEKECPDACNYVSIKNLADRHRKSFDCQPILVVDGMSLLNRLYQNSSLEWIYGGQWLQLVNILKDFISKFISIGVKLVFFFDGTIRETKRVEWVRRRVSKYKTIASIFEGIKSSFSEPDRFFFQLPTSMGSISRFALKELGAEVYQTDRDADDVIAEYANKNKEVFGILSQDSDFIIYRTKMYLSLLHLNLETLQTIHYNRDCFASQYLNLRVSQLPLFACFNGNDYIPSEKLKPFHQKVSKNGKIYMGAMAENIGNIINKEGWTGDANNEQELRRIALKVFGDPSLASVIQDGLRSYVIGYFVTTPNLRFKVEPMFQQAVYSRHLNCLNTYIFNLMCKLEYESSETLEDQLCKHRPHSALIFRPVRQRCYGIIFSCPLLSQYKASHMLSQSEDTKFIKEWCAYPGNNMNQPECVKSLPLELYIGPTPTIENVWFKFTEQEKMMLFWSILQVPMEFKVLISIPKHLMVLACILNYFVGGLKSGPLLKPWELAVFIAQALLKKSVDSLEKLQAPLVDAEAVSLSTVFMRGVTTVLMVHGICDAPFPLELAMPWNFFDGKLFHHLYVKTKVKPNINELCCGQDGIMKEFYDLLSVVTRSTVYDGQKMDWQNILDGFNY